MKLYETPSCAVSLVCVEDILTMSTGDWKDELVEQEFGQVQ